VYKIFGAMPTDPMHSVLKGVMAWALSLIFECMMASQMYRLDELAQNFHKGHQQSAHKSFPSQT
jgi:hypothetical protein